MSAFPPPHPRTKIDVTRKIFDIVDTSFVLYSTGSCKVNITCDCDKDKKEVKPEKQAALFAKEFQDKLYKTIFTKDKDDNEPPTNSTTVTTTATPSTSSNHTNCSNDAKVRNDKR